MATVLPARLLYVPKTRTETTTMSTIMATIFEGSSSESDDAASEKEKSGQDTQAAPDLPPLPDVGIAGSPWPGSGQWSTPGTPPAGDQSTGSGDDLGSLPAVPPDEALPPLEEPPDQDQATGERGQATGDSSREQPEGPAWPQEPPLP